jgi:glycosyltransferase involved in cell wall biosynthesis
MPVYNGEKFIREALDSLLAQTFTDFELIISDNASTDHTEAIYREYAARDPRVRYVRQGENRGAIANFQFVLDEAVGEYFMWAAADDVWDVRWIETLLQMSATHQCLAYGLVQTIDVNGNKANHPANFRRFEFTGNRLIRRCKYFMAPGFLGKANPIYGIVPMSYLKKPGILWTESEKHGGDMIFLFVLLSRMEIRHSEGVFLYKRIHGECAGAGVTQQIGQSEVRAKLLAFLRGVVLGPMSGQYMKRSSAIESVLLAAIYPVCVALTAGYAAFYKIRSMLKSHE